MDTQVNTITTKYQQIIIDVPEERVAEFHAFFGRFLARSAAVRRAGRDDRHRHPHGRGCSLRHTAAQASKARGEATPATEV